MAHPQKFDSGNPMYATISDMALSFPGADMKVSHGRPAFFTKKIFVYFGGSMKVDGEWVEHAESIMVLPDPEERGALESDPRVWVPAYLGPYGWLGVDVTESTDLDEIRELMDASFRLTAPKALVAQLDEGRGTSG